jgi:hypothetical protein
MADVERFELSYLYLYLVPDIDINRCRGYCTDHGGDDQPMVGWQISEGLLGSARHTPLGHRCYQNEPPLQVEAVEHTQSPLRMEEVSIEDSRDRIATLVAE